MDGWIPIAIVASGGLVAWGELRARVNGLRKDVDQKASKEVVNIIYQRLNEIDRKLDRLIEGRQ